MLVGFGVGVGVGVGGGRTCDAVGFEGGVGVGGGGVGMGEDLLGFVVNLDGALGRERGFGAVVVVERGEDEAVDGGHDEDFAGEGGHFWECCERAVSGCGGHVFVGGEGEGEGGEGSSRWCYITVGGQVGE